MIVFENVSKLYRKDIWALRNVTLSIPRDDFVFIVGPNGAGKSTLLKLITLEEKPTGGVILVGGRDTAIVADGMLAKFRRRIGVVFQDTRLFPGRSVAENVALPLKIAGESGRVLRERTQSSLETVALSEFAGRPAGELSGGELRRVAIARAIVARPEILLADEPTDSLSPSAAAQVMDLLMDISRSGVTTIVATHDREVVDRLRRRVVRLENGRVTADEAIGAFRE